MTCPDCNRLSAELARLQDLLAAWEARDAQEVADARRIDRMGHWQSVLGLSASEVRVLLALVDRPGVTFAAEHLLKLVRTPRRRAASVGSNLMEVMIYRLRLALRAAGLDCAIETIRGAGYVVWPEAAQTIRVRVGEA